MKSSKRLIDLKLCLLGLPAALAFFALYIVPFAITGWYSLLSNSFSRQFVGLQNYARVLNNPNFRLAVKNTLIILLMTVGGASLLAGLLAYLLLRARRRILALSILVLPLFIPSVSITTLWQAAFHTSAFSSTGSAYCALVSLYLWKYSGAGAALLYAGLRGVERDILDAAALDGAGEVRTYLRISLPCVQANIGLMLLVLLMYAFQLYKESYLLFGAYPCRNMYMIQHYISNHFNKLKFRVKNTKISIIAFFNLTFSFEAKNICWIRCNCRNSYF